MKRTDLSLGMTVAVNQGKYYTPYQATVVYLDPYHTSSYRRRGDARLTFTYDGQTLEAPVSVTTFSPSREAAAREVLVQREDGRVISVPLNYVKPVEFISEREAEVRAKNEADRQRRAAERAHRDRLAAAAARVNALLENESAMRAPAYVSNRFEEASLRVETLEALLDLAEHCLNTHQGETR